MYLPTMEGRHGELASPMGIDEARRYFKHGWLFEIRRDGEWVSGVVCYRLCDTLIAVIQGTLNADMTLIREGAAAAIYWASIHYANQQRLRLVSFMGSGARLETGLFQHKRKWGSTVRIPSDLHRRIWIQVQRLTPVVSRFLKENPFIVVDDRGELHGLIIVDDPGSVTTATQERWAKRYATPGLKDLLVCSVNSFAERQDVVGEPSMVIPEGSASQRAKDGQSRH
jgi:hypothetical protein